MGRKLNGRGYNKSKIVGALISFHPLVAVAIVWLQA